MNRLILVSLFILVAFIGCETTDNPANTPVVPEDVQMTFTADPENLPCGDADAFSTITATLEDTEGNPLPAGLPVSFSTSLGSIQSTATTDEDGRAIVRFLPAPEPGVAEINATYEGVHGPIEGGGSVCIVDPEKPIYIEIEADPTEISVAGVGRNETSIITATVRNGIGDPITEDVAIFFEMINEPDLPAGCSMNGNGQDEELETVEGVASVGLNAGTQIGGKLIRVYVEDEERNVITSATAALVSVVGGPAFQLDIDLNNIGKDVGGGAWMVEVAARVWDIHRNPVADGWPVVFTVEPEIANISTGFTGNENSNGVATQGLAFGELVYHSVNTFEEIEISANIMVDRGLIMGAREAFLPLQRGRLDLNIDPGNWHFNEERDQSDVRCWATLKDGHGVAINNAPVVFTTSQSRFWWKDFSNDRFIMFFPDPSIKYTGIVDRQNNEQPGHATVYLRGEEEDYFLDPFTLETTVKIEAKVEGFDDVYAEPKFMLFSRAAG